MITKVVVEANGEIIIHREERTKLAWLDLRHGHTYEQLDMEMWHLLTENGFEYVVYGWKGYAYARNVNGLWHEVDLQEKKIGNPIGTSLPDSFFLGHVVSEQDWGRWVRNIKLERKGIFS